MILVKNLNQIRINTPKNPNKERVDITGQKTKDEIMFERI